MENTQEDRRHGGMSDPGQPAEALPFEVWELERSISERFEKIAAAFPDHPAFKNPDGQELTYAELNRRANHLAARIIAAKGPKGGQAAFLIDHEGPQVLAIMGILKAGWCYVPLDPEHPEARMAFMLEDTETRVLVTDAPNLALAERLAQGRLDLIRLEDLEQEGPAEDPGVLCSGEDLACIYYTSGSTGEPKGVMHSHRGHLHVAWISARHYDLRPGDRVVNLTSIGFLFSMVSAIAPLLCGAAMLPYDIKRRGLTPLAPWLTVEDIAIFVSVPSLFRQWAEALPPGPLLPRLRLVVMTGEAARRSDLELLRAHLSPHCALRPYYAGSEVRLTTDLLVADGTEFAGDIIPAGRPVDGKEVLIWDEEGRPVPEGEIGEVVVRSIYFASGYWRRPDLTTAAFHPDPRGGPAYLYHTGDLGRFLPGGILSVLGRKEGFVKLRGYRIELGEVEAALRRLEGIGEAVAMVKEDPHQRPVLAAYVVTAGGAPEPDRWRAELGRTLPSYMVPSHFVILPALPLNRNGKVDRRTLPELKTARRETGPDFLAPRNEIEARLARIFESVLGVQPVGVRDEFEALGGDSLAYLWLFSEVEKEFAVALPDEALAGGATVERLAGLLVRGEKLLEERERGFLPGSEEAWAKRLSWVVGLMTALLNYRRTVRLLGAITGRRRGRWGSGGRQARTFRRLLAVLGSDTAAAPAIIHQHLAGNLGHSYLGIALARAGSGEIARVVSVEGAAYLNEVRGQGRGVILLAGHQSIGCLVPLMLHEMGIDDQVVVGKYSADLLLMGLEQICRNSLAGTDTSDSVLARQLVRGRRMLARGGVVEILGDGLYGDSPEIEVDFLGRRRSLKTGFAELSLSAGAPVVPVAVSWRLDGGATVSFHPPLAAQGQSRSERAESLVRQYAVFLEDLWRRHPADIYWPFVERFLECPEGSGRA